MFEWIGLSPGVLWWIVVVSAAAFVLALLAVPLIAIRIPSDYFSHSRRRDADYLRKPAWVRWIWLSLKNLLGFGFLFLGSLMLVLPEQGILTILIGIMLLDFPGKYRLQQWVVTRKGVMGTVNWIRCQQGADPLELESDREADTTTLRDSWLEVQQKTKY